MTCTPQPRNEIPRNHTHARVRSPTALFTRNQLITCDYQSVNDIIDNGTYVRIIALTVLVDCDPPRFRTCGLRNEAAPQMRAAEPSRSAPEHPARVVSRVAAVLLRAVSQGLSDRYYVIISLILRHSFHVGETKQCHDYSLLAAEAASGRSTALGHVVDDGGSPQTRDRDYGRRQSSITNSTWWSSTITNNTWRITRDGDDR